MAASRPEEAKPTDVDGQTKVKSNRSSSLKPRGLGPFTDPTPEDSVGVESLSSLSSTKVSLDYRLTPRLTLTDTGPLYL